MPSYLREGSVPHKRHIQFRRPDGGLYAEELFSTKGFESVYSLLYHLRPPTATLDVRPWNRPSVTFVDNEPLRNRHIKSAALRLGPDPIESRTPLLGNAESGAVATLFSVPVSIVSGGLLCVAGCLACALLLPAFRAFDLREWTAAPGGAMPTP